MQLLRKLFGARSVDVAHSRDAGLATDPEGVKAGGNAVTTSERYLASGRFAAALSAIDAALSSRPDDATLQLARISTLLAWGRYHEAGADLSQLASNPQQSPEHCARLAGALLHLGNLQAAESWMRKAITGDPTSAAHRSGLAAVLHRQERLDEAAAAYGEILARQPADFDAAMGLGSCELDRHNPVAAESCFRQAMAIDIERAVAWMFLGVALDRQDRGAEGLAAHERATQLEQAHGEDVDAYLGLAGSLRDAGRFADALALLDSNLQRRQGAEAQMLRAHMLLALGRLPEGWQQNESRWLTGHFLARRGGDGKPAWAGQELAGATILLRAEQGMGDTIQFARYASLVKALGAKVLLAVPHDLVRLAQGMHGVDRVLDLSRAGTMPTFDYCISLLSLPRVFGTDLAGIPANVPYVDVERLRTERWATRFAADRGMLRVGLVWGGNPVNQEDLYRSLPLSTLAPLGDVAGVRFYSLQKGAREADADVPPPGLELVNLGPELADFADTAAAIGELDLVISVCTSVAHLTGALGKPVWVMLHRGADWRWLTERSDSPWYPTARLFRQTRRGEWADVVSRIKTALEERVCAGKDVPFPVARARVSRTMPRVTRPAEAPGFRPGYSAVTQARAGTLEYFPGDDGVGDSIGWYGEWLQPQLDLLVRMIRPGSTLMEVGAGIGAHAAILGKILGEDGHLFIYEWREPMPRVLRQNLVANDLTAVTIMRGRIGRSGSSGIPSADEVALAGASPLKSETQTESLDELRLSRLDWLKISEDVAGPEVLAGATATLWRLRPALFLAGANAAVLDQISAIAKAHGYRCWRHECAMFNRANFNRRNNDIFSGRTALAVLAFPEEVEVDLPLADCVELT